MDDHGWRWKDSNNLSQGAYVCEDEDTTTLPKKCARRSVDVVAGVRIVRSHASMDVVKQKWSDEELHLENARKLRGIYFIDPEDTEFKETIKNA